MQILINIPEVAYNHIKRLKYPTAFEKSIQKGIVLTKGHGRLIDADELDVITVTTDDYSGNEVLDVILKEDLDEAPTVIEADKER